MFSKANIFFKKNILLIGIVVLLIIIAIYFLYTYIKEGFNNSANMVVNGFPMEKVQLIPVSTIEKIYNNLPNQTFKDIGAPIVELYKLFVANYNEAFDVSLQIVAAEKEWRAAAEKEDQNQQDAQQIQLAQNQQTSTRNVVLKTWAPKINPGIQNVLINAIRWLPTAKQYYDKFVSNNYYGLLDGTLLPPDQAGREKMLTLYVLAANTLYEDDQLKTLFGPDFAKGSPTLPIPLPTSNEQILQMLDDWNRAQVPASREEDAASREELMRKVRNLQNQLQEVGYRAREYFLNYGKTLSIPFMVIQQYLTENAMDERVNSVIPNTIIQLIEQLNTALANDATDQASIGQLTGQLNSALANDARDLASIGQLTGQLNSALANDATDQASITRLEGKVNKLQTQLSAVLPPYSPYPPYPRTYPPYNQPYNRNPQVRR